MLGGGGILDQEKFHVHYLTWTRHVSFAGSLIVLVQAGTPTLLYLSLCVCVGGGTRSV